MQALAEKMDQDIPTAIRQGLDDWLTTESASEVFRSYSLDLAEITGQKPRRRGADVLRLEPRTEQPNERTDGADERGIS